MATVTVNCMVRDEPFAFFGVASVAPYADKVLIFDTGSTDGTLEELRELKTIYDNIELVELQLPNCQDWTLKNGEGVKINFTREDAAKVGAIRQQMHNMSDTDYIWILDGDEVYSEASAISARDIVNKNLYGNEAFSLPFVDLVNDNRYVRLRHQMFRLFDKEKTEVRGIFTEEMHFSKNTGLCFDVGTPGTGLLHVVYDESRVWHGESLVKPWRKTTNSFDLYVGRQPEVFEKYKDKTKRIKKWLVA